MKTLKCKEIDLWSIEIDAVDLGEIIYSKSGRKFGWKKIWINYINYLNSLGEFLVALQEDNRILRKLLKMKNRKLSFYIEEI